MGSIEVIRRQLICIKRHIHEKKRIKQITIKNLEDVLERLEKMPITDNEAGQNWRKDYIIRLKLDIIIKTNAFDSSIVAHKLKYDTLVREVFNMVDEVDQFQFLPDVAAGLQGV